MKSQKALAPHSSLHRTPPQDRGAGLGTLVEAGQSAHPRGSRSRTPICLLAGAKPGCAGRKRGKERRRQQEEPALAQVTERPASRLSRDHGDEHADRCDSLVPPRVVGSALYEEIARLEEDFLFVDEEEDFTGQNEDVGDSP